MDISTVNVAITTNTDIVGTFFLGKTNSIKAKANSNLENIEDLFLFSPGKDSGFLGLEHKFVDKQITLELKFIDPDKEFENKLITTNFLEMIAGITKRVGLSADNEKSKTLFIQEINRQLERGEGTFPFLYVSYGVGRDIKKWSGPHSFQLIYANVDVSKGARVITLGMAPLNAPLPNEFYLQSLKDGRRMSIHPPLNSNLVKIRCEGVGKPLKEYSTKKETFDIGFTSGKSRSIEQAKAAPRFTLSSRYVIDFDWHRMIKDVLKDYLVKSCFTDNVLILLPDANKVLNPIINIFKQRFAEAERRASKKITQDFLLSGKDSKFAQGADVAKYKLVETVLASLGMNLSYPSEERPKYGDYRQIAEDYTTFHQNFDKVKPSISVNIEAGKEDNEGLYNNPLKAFQKGFRGSTYSPDLVFAVENNVRVLDLWQRKLKIGDGVSPMVVYGDIQVINNFLYHKNFFSKKVSNTKIFGGDKSNIKVKAQLGENIKQIKETLINLIYVKLDNFVGPTQEQKNQLKMIEFLVEQLDSDKGIVSVADILHPDDIEGLTNQEYIKDIIEVFPTISEEFFELDKEKQTKTNNIPIFKANIKNMNVTKVEIDLKPYYFAALGTGFQENFISQAISSLSKVGYSLEKLYPKRHVLLQIIQDFIETNREEGIRQKLKKEFGHTFQDAVSLDTFVSFVLAFATNTIGTKVPTLLIDPDSTIHPITMQQQVFQDVLNGGVWETKIKTLPMFQLSNYADFTRSCLFLMDDLEIEGAIRKKVSFGRDSLYSGRYIITGFTHTINANEVHSEFRLLKTIKAGISKENIEITEKIKKVKAVVSKEKIKKIKAKKTYPIDRLFPYSPFTGNK